MKAGPVTVRQFPENDNGFVFPFIKGITFGPVTSSGSHSGMMCEPKAIERLNGREHRFSYFMGAVVLEARGTVFSRQVTSYQVVDGQQRLTTFQLYLAAARD